MSVAIESKPLVQVIPLGDYNGHPYQHIRFNTHEGQTKALSSKKRFVLVLAGWRSGKTAIGPLWLYKEMLDKGPGDYLVATPDYSLLSKAAAPELDHFFSRIMGLGRLWSSPFEYRISAIGEKRLWPTITPERPTRIVFGHADEPDSLASMRAKAAWLDEPGQRKFKIGSWEEIRARLAIDMGRCLLTTRPYSLNWVKSIFYDPWASANRNHPEIDVINFASVMNPVFPKEEDQQAKMSLPKWKYNMQFLGLFERPAGLIYDCFDSTKHIVPAFLIRPEWPRFLGLDFGGVNTAGVFIARDPKTPDTAPKFYLYREYHAGNRTAQQHADAILAGEPGIPVTSGGSKSEGQWRDEFAAAGLYVREPQVADVEVGINRVYGLFQRGELFILDSCTKTLDEIQSYSREVDDVGEPTEKIADKETYHLLDSLRYGSANLQQDAGFGFDAGGSAVDQMPPGVFNS